jgi:hypothetical protein
VIRFGAIIKIRGVNPYVRVSAKRAGMIKKGWARPMPVTVRVNNAPKKPWRINMMPSGDGSFYLYLHGAVRKASKAAVGDKVIVEVSFDGEYKRGPAHPMPRRFNTALARNPTAKKAWVSLTPSRKKEILRYFASLKSDEAKARNLARAITILSGSEARFLGRTWKDGK